MKSRINNILLVDDDDDFRMAARLVFEVEGFKVLEAGNGSEAIASFKTHVPDLVIIDMKMPGISGIDTIRELKHINGNVPVIILTAFGTIPDAVKAMQDGVINFIQKTAPFDNVLDVVREAIERSRKGNLSDREIEIINWVKDGKSNHEIGIALNITESTVKAHLKHLYHKLNVVNRAQAIHAAISLGIIQADKR